MMKVKNKCCFVYGFLLSCFMLLVLAQEHDHDECLKPQPCGYLGDISFPFTTTQKPHCGLPIKGCDDPHSAVKQIQLTKNHQWYTVDTIFKNYISILIYYPHFDTQLPPPPPPEEEQLKNYFKINNNITFFKCLPDYTFKANKSLNPPNMSLYRNCDYYNIYFTSSSGLNIPFPVLPFPCLTFQSLPSEQGSTITPTCPSSTFMFSFLEINFHYCEDCHHPQQCLFNSDKEIFTCVHHDEKQKQQTPPAVTKGRNRKPKIGLAVGIPSAVAVVALVVVILLLYKRRKKYSGLQIQSKSAYSASFRNTTSRESGALYLGINVFSYEELQEATNNFDQARELGEGGFGTVYYGKLKDGREVAVKHLFERNYRPVESFINEIQILTRLHHRNLVSLYGCTSRHSRELLLVYEYIPNGTLSSHLHGDQANPMSLPWPVRMKIAIETASALAYLHASDIIHRDVKTSNILIDNDFGVKVADFGLSRLFPDEATHVSTAPRGTPGYVDPDYRLCYQLTAKSDVYSFGVVLVELISSLKAVDMNRSRDDIKLANLALRKIQKGAFCELVDPFLGFQSDENLKRMIVSVAELAFRCLQGDKELRPCMGEVLEVLQRIQSEGDEPRNLEGIVVHGATRASQSYTHPPLPNTLMRPKLGLHQTH